MKLKLFLTFDHELPLGKLKTSYSSSLFEPTQRVMDLADKLGVKVTLFSDILCGVRFKDWDYSNFYLPYVNQLQTAIKSGHDVQLHIHPHWLSSRFENGDYLPSNDFALSDFKINNRYGTIQSIVKMSAQALTEICKAVNPLYKCIAFRAGGFNLESCSEDILDALYAVGIRYDSSMLRGYYFKSSVSEVNFRHLPSMGNWTVDHKNIHKSSDTSGIIEIPVATIPKTPFEIPTAFKMKKYAERAPAPHGKVIHQSLNVDILSKLKILFSSRILSFDNYTLSLDYLMRMLKYNLEKYKSQDVLMLSIISHPKSMGDYSFQLMEHFVIKVKELYPEVEFETFKNLL